MHERGQVTEAAFQRREHAAHFIAAAHLESVTEIAGSERLGRLQRFARRTGDRPRDGGSHHHRKQHGKCGQAEQHVAGPDKAVVGLLDRGHGQVAPTGHDFIELFEIGTLRSGQRYHQPGPRAGELPRAKLAQHHVKLAVVGFARGGEIGKDLLQVRAAGSRHQLAKRIERPLHLLAHPVDALRVLLHQGGIFSQRGVAHHHADLQRILFDMAKVNHLEQAPLHGLVHRSIHARQRGQTKCRNADQQQHHQQKGQGQAGPYAKVSQPGHLIPSGHFLISILFVSCAQGIVVADNCRMGCLSAVTEHFLKGI